MENLLMLTRRNFTKIVVASGISASITNQNAFSLALNGEQGTSASNGKKPPLPDWSTHIDPDF
jgi:hypothetical protein